MHVWPRMTQAIEMARKPWIDGIVSLPTLRSQIALKLLMTENDSNSSDQTPETRAKSLDYIYQLNCNGFVVSSLTYSIWFPQHWWNLLRDFRPNCCCSCRVEWRCQWVNRPYSAPNWSNRTWCNQYPTTNRWRCHLLRDAYFSMHFWRDESAAAHKWLRSQEAHPQSTIQRYCRNEEIHDSLLISLFRPNLKTVWNLQ